MQAFGTGVQAGGEPLLVPALLCALGVWAHSVLLECLCGTQTRPDSFVPVSTVCVNVPSFAPGLL